MELLSLWPEELLNNLTILSEVEVRIANLLTSLDQGHLFLGWDEAGVNDDLKHKFFEQAQTLNASYPNDGISGYVRQARKLLEVARSGENPLDGWKPEVPHGVSLEPFNSSFSEYESLGISEIGQCGFVLVAGGLGERLGYTGVKVALPCEMFTGLTYLSMYCSVILEIERRYSSYKPLPLAIMVSDDTYLGTIELLQSNNFFGLTSQQVTIMKQEKVAAIQSSSGQIAKISKYVIDSKPHGHGDVHLLMHATGTAQRWLDEGTRWCVFLQDTNGLGLYSLAVMLGVSASLGLEVNSLSIPRFAKQSVGAITKLVHKDGRHVTINVEYNQLDPLLRATICAEGDVNDPATGYSPFPGNINQLVFRMEPYCENLQSSKGVMTEFVNPKFADKTRLTFKKPTRLECMMQDYPKILTTDSLVGFTSVPNWFAYSPCKNNAADGAALVQSGVPAASAATAECDQYNFFAELMRQHGACVERAAAVTALGISIVPMPRIIFRPSFCMHVSDLARCFPVPEQVVVSAASSLLVEGSVQVCALRLAGSLRLVAVPGTSMTVLTMTVSNAGAVMHMLDSLAPGSSQTTEVDRMRGYVWETLEELVISTPAPLAENAPVAHYLFDGQTLTLQDQP